MPLAAIGLLSLLGFAALAIDVGYLFVVRNELQNAADAAALAGAGHLTPYIRRALHPTGCGCEYRGNQCHFAE